MIIDGHLYDLSDIDRALYKQKVSHQLDARGSYKGMLLSTWVGYALSKAKMRAKKKGIEFSILREDVHLPTHCPVFGTELKVGGHADTSPSLDRIDNSKGYVRGNVHIISGRANRIKSNATIQELVKLADYFSQYLDKSDI